MVFDKMASSTCKCHKLESRRTPKSSTALTVSIWPAGIMDSCWLWC